MRAGGIATGRRQTTLTSRALLHEGRQQWKVAGQVGEHRLQIALDGPGSAAPRALRGLARVAPLGELARDRLLDRLAVCEVGRTARASADEVGLVQREALGQRRHLDQAGHALGRGGREGDPIPPSPDNLAESADGHAA